MAIRLAAAFASSATVRAGLQLDYDMAQAMSHGGVLSADIDRATADLRVHFEGDTRLDIFNHSSGYEGWQARLRTESAVISIIGMGGGDVAVLHARP